MGRRNKTKRLVEGEVVDIGAKGMAVCRTDEGEVFLVQDAVPGDRISALLIRKRKGMWTGSIQEILRLSPQRVDPPCIHFEYCGGCKWQNLMYSSQIELKEKSVREAMRRIGGLKIGEFFPIIGCDEIYEYRNKLEFTFSDQRWLTEAEMRDRDEQTELKGLGFHRPGRFDKVLDVHECLLQRSPSNAIRNHIREKALEMGLSFYNARSQEGYLRNLIIRTTETGDLMVILIVKEKNQEALDALLSDLISAFPEITSLQYVVNPKVNDTIYDLPIHVFHGEPYMTEKLGEKLFHIGPKSFFQTNSRQAKVLYDQVVRFADFDGDEIVYDLYSGLGSIGIYLADRVRKVVGIEEVEEAVEWSLKNSELNAAENCSYFKGDVREVLTDAFIARHGPPDVLIVDPPRAGLHPDVVDFILGLEPNKIIYVSCNPATQARDMAVWKEKYECVAMQPVDMFPHTSHIENVALLHLVKEKSDDVTTQ